MVTFNAVIRSKHSPKLVFDYLSMFSNASQWDPGITAGNPLESGVVSKGSKFRLDFNLLGREVELTYELIEYDRPNRFVVAANGGKFVSHDEITVDSLGAGSKVRYEATLQFSGIAKMFIPLWAIVFRRIGSKAAKGLEDWLNRDNLSSASQDATGN